MFQLCIIIYAYCEKFVSLCSPLFFKFYYPSHGHLLYELPLGVFFGLVNGALWHMEGAIVSLQVCTEMGMILDGGEHTGKKRHSGVVGCEPDSRGLLGVLGLEPDSRGLLGL